jgi:hypothetical protein
MHLRKRVIHRAQIRLIPTWSEGLVLMMSRVGVGKDVGFGFQARPKEANYCGAIGFKLDAIKLFSMIDEQ